MELSESTKDLAAKYAIWQKSLKPKEGVLTLHVDEVASKIAAFYEQIRTIVDWKEEHLMRRAAIIRKLKRRFLDLEMGNVLAQDIAEPLVLELIRGGYFPNDRIEESKVAEVKNIISKYIFILQNSPENKENKSGLAFYAKLLEIAACEIEETLAPSIKEMALMDYMFFNMKERIRVSQAIYDKNLLKKDEKDIQIYIAVQRALFKLDGPIISYNLLKYKYPYWDNPSQDDLLKISSNMHQILNGIETDLNHPLSKKFYAVCEKYDTPYLLLGDILSKDTEDTMKKIAEPSSLEELIKNAYGKRLANLNSRINRAAVYSTASIFVTKILSLVVIEELVLGVIFKENFNPIFLAANILIPTLLMAALVTSIPPPSKKNINLAVIETMKIVYQKEKHDFYEIKISGQRGFFTKFFLSFIYLAGAGVTLGFLYLVFRFFQFPLFSIIINFIFIALILFAGGAIQKRSQELTIEEEHEGFSGFIFDILFLPIAETGRWLSNTVKQYNFIAAFFSALIDMPFSAFVEFLERWRYFLKEKKEEIR